MVIYYLLWFFSIILAFHGYAIYKFLFALLGAIMGAAAGAFIGFAASVRTDRWGRIIGYNTALMVILGLVFLIVFALIAFKLHRLMVFLNFSIPTFFICFFAFAASAPSMGGASGGELILGSTLIAVLVGLFGLWLEKFLIILLTSLFGGYMTGGHGVFISQSFRMNDTVMFVIIGVHVVAGIALFIGGMVYQYKTSDRYAMGEPVKYSAGDQATSDFLSNVKPVRRALARRSFDDYDNQ